MLTVLLGGIPAGPLRHLVLRSPTFLGNLLHARGVEISAIVATPYPWRGVLREKREQGMRLLARPGSTAPAPAQTAGAARMPAVPVHRVPGTRHPRCVEVLERLKPDLVVYLGGREILPRRLLEVPRLGVLGAHWGPLPRYRGMNATEWAVFCGDAPGVAVQFFATGVDTGNVVMQRPIPVLAGDTVASLRGRAAQAGKALLVEAAVAVTTGRARPEPQRPDDGLQYFVMDERLRAVLNRRLAGRAPAHELPAFPDPAPAAG